MEKLMRQLPKFSGKCPVTGRGDNAKVTQSDTKVTYR